MHRALLLIFFAALCWPTLSHAQLSDFEDLEAVAEKGFFKQRFTELYRGFADFGDPLTLSGGIALDLRSYSASGIAPRQDPFFYSLGVNVNARIYKLNLPLSLLVTAKNTESSYPNFRELGNAFGDRVGEGIRNQRDRFVRFGVSPHYKWARGHFGHRTMTFSQFTLSNLNFLGAGLELTPGNWVAAELYPTLGAGEVTVLATLPDVSEVYIDVVRVSGAVAKTYRVAPTTRVAETIDLPGAGTWFVRVRHLYGARTLRAVVR